MVLQWSIIMSYLLWVAYILYLACFIPQVLTNHRRRSANGLSKTTIFIYFLGYLVEILYAFFLNLPTALKVMIPMGAGIAGTLVLQRIYFDTSGSQRRFTMRVYVVVLACFTLMACIGKWYPYQVGHLCGWLGSLCWLVYQIPQVYKLHMSKSVVGYNPWALLIASLGALIEVPAAVLIPLPAQGLFNGMRGLFFSTILAAQYWRYRTK